MDAAKQRLSALEQQESARELTPAEEKERFAALGELVANDPMWALHRELTADAVALNPGNPQTPKDRAMFEELKQFLFITADLEQRVTTLPEAKAFASILRQFIVHHDVNGATAWAKAQ